ncbi:MAG TPA: class III lanthionine synthetase LanKC [Thermoanaerobaculia bacterium]|jgi:serine/threonine protein kinase
MLVEDSFFYLHADPELFEPLERYVARSGDFLDPVRRIVPDDWRLSRNSIWLHCSPPGAELPPHGWKIHLSATPASSPAVLTTAARLLVRAGVPFKFAADKAILMLLNGKRWLRGGAGKFVTIYPADTAQCGELLEILHQALIGYAGPYILSDRRYRDSGVVHYRYGGIHPTRRLDVTGRGIPVMRLQDGQIVDDERLPFFNLPQGVSDPFATGPEPTDPEAEGTLKHGRYAVQSVIGFSNPGGVYVALDRQTGRKVLIKEARPLTNVSPQGTDAVWLLKKEHRLLTLLEDTGVAPRPLDFFKDWEHYYLVEELVEGVVLRSFLVQHTLGLRTRASGEHAVEFFRRYRRLFTRIIEALQTVHERGIVFSDLSYYNVIVMGDGEEVRLIDFEGAFEAGIDIPVSLYTPGFVPSQVVEEGTARREDDYFALGGLMLAGLFPANSLLMLNPRAHEPFLEAMVRDIGLPAELAAVIRDLLVQDRSRRPDLSAALQALAVDPPLREPEHHPLEAGQEEEHAGLLNRMVGFILSLADFSRHDRLFPADPAVFETNPLSIAHGACGVAYALQRITGKVPQQVIDWMLSRPLSAEEYPPGLYIGLSGIAWSLLELGLPDRAGEVMEMANGHPLRWRSPDLFHGASGWGMSQLRFFLATGDEAYLARAEEAGRFLETSRQEDEGGCWWPSAQGEVCCGLAHGASGVSLFLLYLYLATQDERYLSLGHKGLRFVAARGLRNADGGLTWKAKEGEPTYTPYWRWGSAGVGMTLLRYRRALGDLIPETGLLPDLFIDADRKYTIFPGRFFGLAGLGELHLDLAESGDDRELALTAARRALAGILLFQLPRPGGLAFPGDSLARISCDLGSAPAARGSRSSSIVSCGEARRRSCWTNCWPLLE